MKYNIQCPHCGNILTVEEEWAGQQSFCSHCHLQLTIPPPPSAGEVPPVYLANQSHGGEQQYLAIAGFVVSLFCCCFVGLILAIVADQRMRQSGDFKGHGWCVATYWVVGLQIVLGIIQVLCGSLFSL